MKQRFTKKALAFLITGLMLVTLTPIINKHYHLPDGAAGFITGIGLASEVIALALMQKERKRTCQL
ncbi:hypothetical protein [Mucilaginibacter ginkgonis]|uniref:Uncharacterized protein n=1 Tax=Mucilaginibacter ginkgonis TaxID=2682091 RepID=A0A6I4I4W2_9SPHI|nr:hypothetical protein [Mucilaginibacter ginkgonis]QQL49052.1 hypothetical protein GO620_012810 [Mucilaginibacter ginkgonis]